MKKVSILLFLLCCSSLVTKSVAQENIAALEAKIEKLNAKVEELEKSSSKRFKLFKSGKSKFMLRGYFHSGFEGDFSGSESQYNFSGGSINPILMYKHSDRLFFEAEFEGGFTSEGEFEWGMEYADMSFVINKYITARAGKFILPFGTFMEKLHPAWINRMATRPLGFGHDGISPGSDVGVEVRGAFNAGPTKFNYQLYVVNGPQLKDGSVEPEEAGMLNFEFKKDNNQNKAVGGRIGFFPFSNSMLELGLSGLTAKVGDKDSPYENVRANLYSIDLNFVKSLSFMKSVIDIKGQYNYSQVSDASYTVPDDTTDLFYDFNNVSSGYYAQLSVRPSLLGNNFIRRLEVVGRYSALQTPEGSLWEQTTDQWTVGLNYWLNWRTVIKLGYQVTNASVGGSDHDGGGAHDGGSVSGIKNAFYIHWAMGF